MSQKCVLCPLHKDSRINLMSGVGPQPAKILFVGEAAGEEEERTGVPFTGPAGQLFDQLLKSAGIDRSEVRITNTVRCRPVDKTSTRQDRRGIVHFGNRAPTPEEVYVCAPTYLDKEIEATQPHVIVPVGNTALHYFASEYSVKGYNKDATTGAFTPDLIKSTEKLTNIMASRGIEKWNEKFKCKQIPIIHPSALLRGARQINVTIEDLRRIKVAAETKEIQKVAPGQYEVIDTWEMVEWALARLEASSEFTVDVETTGFDWMRDRLICIGFSWKERTGISIRILDEVGKPIYTTEQEQMLKDRLNKLFQDESKLVICFNGKFDFHHLMSYGIKYPKRVFDAMLAHHLLDSETEHGLKTLSWVYTDMGGYEDALDKIFAGKKKMEKDFMSVPRDIMGKYNAMDCDCTLRLKNRFAFDMKQFPKMEEFFHNWLMHIQQTVLMIERNGIPVDFDLIRDMYSRMEKRCNEIEEQFKTHLGLTNGSEFNINSTKQLREVFFGQMKLDPPTKIGASGPSLDEESINELVKKYPTNPLLQLVTEYRGLQKSMSTYLVGIKNAALFGRSATSEKVKDACWSPEQVKSLGLVTDGRVHCDYLLHGTVTGRLSSRNPNLQNIPRVTDEDVKRGFVIRSVFIADTGWKLVAADLSQAELWILYALSKDKNLYDALTSKEGVHLRFASQLFNVPYTSVSSEQKAIAKTVVFGIVYGRQAQSIAEQFKISNDQAQSYVDGFHNNFPAASYWMSETVARAKVEKKVWSVFGRVRHLPAIDSPHYLSRLDAEHQAVNFPIQSPASDVTQIAGTKTRWEIEKLGLKSQAVLTIHDDNTYHVPSNELEIISKIVTANMTAHVPELGIPMRVKLEISDRWKHEEPKQEEKGEQTHV